MTHCNVLSSWEVIHVNVCCHSDEVLKWCQQGAADI